MLSYLMEDFYKILSTLEKVPEDDRINMEDVVNKIQRKIVTSNNAYEICNWYNSNIALRDDIYKFIRHENSYIAKIGNEMEWLLTKGAYFYSDD